MSGLANVMREHNKEQKTAKVKSLLGNGLKQIYYLYLSTYHTHPIDIYDMIDGIIATRL